MYLIVDPLDLPQDAEFSCQVTYDCVGIKPLVPELSNHTVSKIENKTTESTTNFPEIQQTITPSYNEVQATESTTDSQEMQQTITSSIDIGINVRCIYNVGNCLIELYLDRLIYII